MNGTSVPKSCLFISRLLRPGLTTSGRDTPRTDHKHISSRTLKQWNNIKRILNIEIIFVVDVQHGAKRLFSSSVQRFEVTENKLHRTHRSLQLTHR